MHTLRAMHTEMRLSADLAYGIVMKLETSMHTCVHVLCELLVLQMCVINVQTCIHKLSFMLETDARMHVNIYTYA